MTAGDKHPEPKLRDRVELIVSSAIVSGDLFPGEIVSTGALARELGISATPVREALLNLEKRGFVSAVRNVGFRITELDEKELANIASVRRMVEPAAMAELAASFNESALPELRRMAREITAEVQAGDLGAYLAADRHFHLALTAMLDNQVLYDIIADLRSRTRLEGLVPLLKNHELDVLSAEHDVLLDYLTAGDAAGARSLMDQHVGHITGRWSGRDELGLVSD